MEHKDTLHYNNLSEKEVERITITAPDLVELRKQENDLLSYSYPAFVVLFNLGMRIGEMAALTWEDVNFKENTITIDKKTGQQKVDKRNRKQWKYSLCNQSMTVSAKRSQKPPQN